jgi:hypothetical protein
MKIFYCFLLSLFFYKGFAQTEQQLITQADKYETALNETAAFESFKQAIKINSRNHYALWKLSELCSRIGKRQPTTKQKQQ